MKNKQLTQFVTFLSTVLLTSLLNPLFAQCNCKDLKERITACDVSNSEKDGTITSQKSKIATLNAEIKGCEARYKQSLSDAGGANSGLLYANSILIRDTTDLKRRVRLQRSDSLAHRKILDSLNRQVMSMQTIVKEQSAQKDQQSVEMKKQIQQKSDSLVLVANLLTQTKDRNKETVSGLKEVIKLARDSTQSSIVERCDRIVNSSTDTLYFMGERKAIKNFIVAQVPFKSGLDKPDSEQEKEWTERLCRLKRLMWHYQGRNYKIKIVGMENVSNSETVAKAQAQTVKKYLITPNIPPFNLPIQEEFYKIETEENKATKNTFTPINYVKVYIYSY